ncbi:hypothetical protein LGL08_11190 [Clostridium estertheticum]|uniref:hypothetical protein n=1 Tax=Clostridium estertheticum TaxID=238834 RepID=UPI001CF5D529|nr:hypothetical protein [Clostridium estertheticum]MCB2306526.1 hypothetical protein [Clostridium estertheticum]MCB2345114.1 hypothetical protein [Clostridium estertheticum]MCB2350112.1 hypothetical protein [Clostridium estertheticum]WAG44297.1 hypothetical protein LL127_12005 [Clostridium estertheticum]
MNKQYIVNFLSENDLNDIAEIQYKKGTIALKFKYYYDDAEIEAAKSYADDEGDFKEEKEEWYEEFFLPYLSDISADNVEDIMEECAEKMEIEYEFIGCDISEDAYEFNEFAVVFYGKDSDIDTDDILLELDF